MDWLKSKRMDAGLTMKEIAESIGMTQVSYWQIEHGICKPKVNNAKKIAKLLGFDWRKFYPDELIGKE